MSAARTDVQDGNHEWLVSCVLPLTETFDEYARRTDLSDDERCFLVADVLDLMNHLAALGLPAAVTPTTLVLLRVDASPFPRACLFPAAFFLGVLEMASGRAVPPPARQLAPFVRMLAGRDAAGLVAAMVAPPRLTRRRPTRRSTTSSRRTLPSGAASGRSGRRACCGSTRRRRSSAAASTASSSRRRAATARSSPSRVRPAG